MITKKNLLFKSALLLAIISVVIILQFSVIPTVTRYRQTANDRVRAEYTALFFDHDGYGKVVALEEKYDGSTFQGYYGSFSINLMNYIGEDITERDISYKIYSKQILGDSTNGYYVEGIWGKKHNITNETLNYQVNILGSASDGSGSSQVLESYITKDLPKSGSTNSHIIEILRKPDTNGDGNNDYWPEDVEYEEVTIVIDINDPYNDSIVFNIYVSPRLIVYSVNKISKFQTDCYRLHIQTASSFKKIGQTGYLPDAFRVALNWEGVYFDNTFNEVLKHSSNGTPNPTDISTPCLLIPNLITTEHTLQMYIPAGSEFYIDFYPTSGTITFLALAELKSNNTKKYAAYDEYDHTTIKTVDVGIYLQDNASTTTNVNITNNSFYIIYSE